MESRNKYGDNNAVESAKHKKQHEKIPPQRHCERAKQSSPTLVSAPIHLCVSTKPGLRSARLAMTVGTHTQSNMEKKITKKQYEKNPTKQYSKKNPPEKSRRVENLTRERATLRGVLS